MQIPNAIQPSTEMINIIIVKLILSIFIPTVIAAVRIQAIVTTVKKRGLDAIGYGGGGSPITFSGSGGGGRIPNL